MSWNWYNKTQERNELDNSTNGAFLRIKIFVFDTALNSCDNFLYNLGPVGVGNFEIADW